MEGFTHESSESHEQLEQPHARGGAEAADKPEVFAAAEANETVIAPGESVFTHTNREYEATGDDLEAKRVVAKYTGQAVAVAALHREAAGLPPRSDADMQEAKGNLAEWTKTQFEKRLTPPSPATDQDPQGR